MKPINKIDTFLPHHPNKIYYKRDLAKIDTIIIHHSLTRGGTASAFARYHVQNNNWPGIGYHMVADKNGIHQTNDFNLIAYHCRGQNINSIGICHAGNFDIDKPSPEVYTNLLIAILHVYKTLGREIPIYFHSDFSPKSCPGIHFDKDRFLTMVTMATVLSIMGIKWGS